MATGVIVFIAFVIGARPSPSQVLTSADPPWRYTLDQPSDGWQSPGFDDTDWKRGDGAFGTPGTPGITPKTSWSTSDIWLRREFVLPTDRFDKDATQLRVFHDEDVEIYLNGVLAAQASGFVTDHQVMEIRPAARKFLSPGAKILVAAHCHQTVGGQGIDVAFTTVSPEWFNERRRDNYRSFAMSNNGNAAAGRTLFQNELGTACVRCHSTDGSSSRAGPDLMTVGDRFTREELIDAILHPSAHIAVGYSTTVVTTKDGDAFVGVVKEATDDHVGLMGGDGRMQRIASADIRSRRTQATSLMPDGLESGLKPAEFSDLVEYLVNLRLPAMADAGRAGMPSDIPELHPAISLIPIDSDENRFQHPCWLGQVPGEPGTFLICEHETGRVWRLTTGPNESKTLWGNFRGEVRPGGATGLLGIAFHPHFRENHRYFIQHQLVISDRIVARVSEKIASNDLTRDSGQPSRTIMEFPCSTDVHSGGGISFGPDGCLYIGMGDTGPQGDPEGHAQNMRLPLGKMLRIDVDDQENGRPYAVPKDNPFLGRADARPEIWACGLREPWRFSFDPLNGDLWAGDVGQDRIEEIDVIRRGENYGWNVYEGFDFFSSKYRADGRRYVPPVFAYNRRLGNSVIGGYMYRGGGRGSPFDGIYICGDYNSKRVWGLRASDRKLTGIWQLCVAPEQIASFGQDESGTLYIVGYGGTIFKMDFNSAALPALSVISDPASRAAAQ
jgi:putative heme-binding domain-containing protein